jgi:hypothetical protein
MKKLLLAGAAALALSTAAQADTKDDLPTFDLWEAGPMGPVVQDTWKTPFNLKSCYLQLHAADRANADLLLLKYQDGRIGMKLAFSDTTKVWKNGGQVSFIVDGKAFRFDMKADDHDIVRYSLFLFLDRESDQTLALSQAIAKGHSLVVSFGREVSVIQLNSAATALTVLDKCRDALVASAAPASAVAHPGAADAAPIPMNSGTVELKLFPYGGTPHVPVTFDTHTAYFAVDGGAADVTLPPQVFAQLVISGSINAHRDFIETRQYVLADGRTQTRDVFRLFTLEIGGAVVRNMTVNVGDNDDSGLLGESFLSQFTSWSIDNTRGVLRLSR